MSNTGGYFLFGFQPCLRKTQLVNLHLNLHKTLTLTIPTTTMRTTIASMLASSWAQQFPPCWALWLGTSIPELTPLLEARITSPSLSIASLEVHVSARWTCVMIVYTISWIGGLVPKFNVTKSYFLFLMCWSLFFGFPLLFESSF